jgi:hypothetical protein
MLELVLEWANSKNLYANLWLKAPSLTTVEIQRELHRIRQKEARVNALEAKLPLDKKLYQEVQITVFREVTKRGYLL